MLPTPSDTPSPESRRSLVASRPVMPGDVVSDRYVLEFVLGRGAMGEVWAATHRGLGLPCAIKFLSVDPRFDTLDFDERFEVEARTTARLSTKTRHIVRVTDYGQHQGKPFLVMELLEGETLEERVDREGALEVRPAIRIAEQIANALRVAHADKLVHRDLKSANVFLATDEQGAPLVKVLDFGLVRVLEAAEPASRTSIGLIVGSPHSMSPEQAAGKPIDARSDVWALATVIYEMLTGVSAFEGAQVLEVVSNVVRCQYVPITARDPKYEPLAPVFERAFSRSIDDRFNTVDELVVALRQAAGRTSSPCHEIPVTTAPEIVIDVAEIEEARAKLEAASTAAELARALASSSSSWSSSSSPGAGSELDDTITASSRSLPASTATHPFTRSSVSHSDSLGLGAASDERTSFVPRKRRWLPALVMIAGALAVGVAAAHESGLVDRAYAQTRVLVQPLTVQPLDANANANAPLATQAPVAPATTSATPLASAEPAPKSAVAQPAAVAARPPATTASTTNAPRAPIKVPVPSIVPTQAAPKAVVHPAMAVTATEVPSASASPVPTPTEVPNQGAPVVPSATAVPVLPAPSPGAPNPSDPASLM